MNKKGFISGVILYYFNIALLLILVILNNLNLKYKTLINLEIAHEYLNQETVVISFIKCALINDDLKENSYVSNGINFHVIKQEDQIIVDIYGKYEEVLIIKINGKNIVDYTSSSSNSFGI